MTSGPAVAATLFGDEATSSKPSPQAGLGVTTLGGLSFAGITPEKASEKRTASVKVASNPAYATPSKTYQRSKQRVSEAREGYEKENPVRKSVKSNKTKKSLKSAGTWKKTPAANRRCTECGTLLGADALPHHTVCIPCHKLAQKEESKKNSRPSRQTKNLKVVADALKNDAQKQAGEVDGMKETIAALREELEALNEERDLEAECAAQEKAYAAMKLAEFRKEERKRQLERWSCSFYDDKPHSMVFLIITWVLLLAACATGFWYYPSLRTELVYSAVLGAILLVFVDALVSVTNGRVTIWNGHLLHQYRFVRHVDEKDEEYADCRALAISAGEMLFEDPRGFVFSYSRSWCGISIGASTPFGRQIVHGVASYELLCQLCVHKNVDSDLDDMVALDKMKWMSKTMHAINQSKFRATFPQGAIPEKTCRIAYGILRQARNECADFPSPSMH